MDWFSGIIVFILVWWTAIFLVLPFGLRRDETGKPDDPRLLRKILYTTALSVLIWLVIFALVESGWISFYDMATQLVEQDKHQGAGS